MIKGIRTYVAKLATFLETNRGEIATALESHISDAHDAPGNDNLGESALVEARNPDVFQMRVWLEDDLA